MQQISLFILATLVLQSCQPSMIEYQVDKSDTGPCVIFVCPKSNKAGEDVVIRNGLGIISRKQMRRKFNFFSTDNDTHLKIEIIQPGEEYKITDSANYIFRLGKGNSDQDCGSPEHIAFFYGKRSGYLEWNKKYSSELDYFRAAGTDLCSYYKKECE